MSPESTEQSSCAFLSYFVSNLNWISLTEDDYYTTLWCFGLHRLVSHRYTCVQHILKPTPHPSPPYSSGFSSRSLALDALLHAYVHLKDDFPAWNMCFLCFTYENMGRVFCEITKSAFHFENLVVYVWSWYMAHGMLHIWMAVYTFSYMNMELCISHIRQFEHIFSCRSMEFYIFSIWKSPLRSSDMRYILNSSNTTAWCKFSPWNRNFVHFKNENLGTDYLTWNLVYSISHKDIWA